MRRIAIVGAGNMARVRGRAFLATGEAEICGVAAAHKSSAKKFGREIGCEDCFDDYRNLIETRPDAVLIETPHDVQESIVLWALEADLDVLIGGALAVSVTAAERIRDLAQARGRVVESGYQARYCPLWAAARRMVAGGDLGRLVAARSIALWAGRPETWYYQQQASGGMPLTHMTYCFINPVRWILGQPVAVAAFANRKHHTEAGMVHEETCVANILFEDDVLYSTTAGFVRPGGLECWSATLIGTEAAVELFPEEGKSGRLVIYRGELTETQDFSAGPDAFQVQAERFLRAMDGQGQCHNDPDEAVWDVRISEAIVASARSKQTIQLQ